MLTPIEAEDIAENIRPRLEPVTHQYDFGKYPAHAYREFQDAYAALVPSHRHIQQSLEWKWGHWGKPNYPGHHRALIAEIQTLWPDFSTSAAARQPQATFLWWQTRLGRSTTYITAAFITHLVHHQDALPIIDQHNFRAMNALVASVRPGHAYKKRPSNWDDIANLQSFMALLCERLPEVGIGELDRFLMMYGRYHVVR